MVQASTAPITSDEAALIERARHEAQERVAELHLEEGTVNSEGAQNSPSPDDQIPQSSRRTRRGATFGAWKERAQRAGDTGSRFVAQSPGTSLVLTALVSAALTAAALAIARSRGRY